MPMRIVHGFAMKLPAMLVVPALPAMRIRPMVALTVVEMVIDMSVEMLRPMEPRSGADEHAA